MHWLNRLLIAGLVIGVVAYGPRSLSLASTSNDLERVQRERNALVAKNVIIEAEIRRLRAEARALQNDPQEIARIAREDLNLVMPGEVVFDVEYTGARGSWSR